MQSIKAAARTREMGDNGISTCTSPSIWEEVDQSERWSIAFFFLLNYLISAHYFKINIISIWLYSYLVCSMYEEAASLGSSVLKRLRDSNNNYNEESYDMMESAGMVFVQSLKELGRYITCFFIYRKCWLLFFEVLWLLIYSCCQI